MKLTVIQLLADDINRFQNTSHRIQQKIREACQEGADLILLPECAYPAYMIGLEKEPDSLSNIPDFLSRMSELAALDSTSLRQCSRLAVIPRMQLSIRVSTAPLRVSMDSNIL